MNTPAQGEQMYKGLFAQFIDEDEPGVYNPNGRRVTLTCLKGEFQSEEQWATFRPDGVTIDAWNMLSKSWNIFTCDVVWDFAQAFELFPMFFGVGLVSSPSGAYQEHYAVKPYGSISRKFKTLEWGIPTDCERCTYAFPISFSHNADRDEGQVGGQIVFLCRKAEAVGVNMTGGSPRDAVLEFVATNVSGDGVFDVTIQGEEVQELTLEIGDTENEIEAKLLALGITADVTGIVAVASGEIHTLNANGATGNATIYGDVVVAPGATSDSLQTTVRAKGGNYANVVVAGSTTAYNAAGTRITTGGTSTKPNAFDGNTGTLAVGDAATVPTSFVYDRGAGNATDADKYSIKITDDGTNNPTEFYLEGSNDNTTWDQLDFQPNTVAYTNAEAGFKVAGPFTIASNTAYRYWRLRVTRGGAESGSVVLADINIVKDGTPSTGAYTFTYPQGVGNVADITNTPGTGWSTSTTQPGNAGGTITAQVSEPAATRITIVKQAGNGWTGATTTQGDNGKIRISKRRPVNPKAFGIRIAATRAGLDNAPLMGKVKRFGINYEGAAEAVFFATEGDLSFQSHTDSEERTIGLALQIAHNSPARATLESYATASPVATPFWIELRELGATNEHLRWQFLSSSSGPRARGANGRTFIYDVPLTPVLDDEPFNEDLIADGGASMYIIVRRPSA